MIIKKNNNGLKPHKEATWSVKKMLIYIVINIGYDEYSNYIIKLVNRSTTIESINRKTNKQQ